MPESVNWLWYSHAGCHALHLHDYRAEWQVFGEARTLQPGDLTLSPPDTKTGYRLPRPGEHLCIHFRVVSAENPPALRLPLHFRLGGRRAFFAERILDIVHLHARAQRQTPQAPLAAAAAALALQELMLQLALLDSAAEPELAPRKTRESLDRVVAHLEEHLAENLSIGELAREARLSQNYLSRNFKQRFGVTIQHYRLLRRMEAAHALLTSTDLPVKTIGWQVGVPDPQHFNKLFRRVHGCSPLAARKTVVSESARQRGL